MMTEKERESFLRARTAIGASEVAAVMGLSEWRGPAEVYTRLVMLIDHGDIGDSGNPDNNNLMRGVLLEDVAVKLFEEQSGRKTRRVTEADAVDDKPYLRANPDRIILSAGPHEKTQLLEVKCPRPQTIKKWKEEGLSADALTQVHAQLMCRPRVESAIVWVFNALDPLDSFEVPIARDPAYEEQIDKALKYFWTEYFEARKLPNIVPDYPMPPTIVRELRDVSEDDLLSLSIEQYNAFNALEKEAKDGKKKHRKAIEDAAAGHQAKRLRTGDLTATVGYSQGRPTINMNALTLSLAEHELKLDDYRVPGQPFSTVRITKKKVRP